MARVNDNSKALFAEAPMKSAGIQLSHSSLVSQTLLECIRDGDLVSFRTVLTSCLNSVNKTHLAKSAGIGRQTLYDLINPERGFNPELSTVAAIIRALAHEGKRFHV